MQFRTYPHPPLASRNPSNPLQPRQPPSHEFGFSNRMTAGSPAMRSNAPPAQQQQRTSSNGVSREYFKHSTAKRINTDAVLVDAIREEYPNLHLTVTPTYYCNIQNWSAAGLATLTPIDKEKDQLRWRGYVRPYSKLEGGGHVEERVLFGKFLLNWEDKEYVVYIGDTRDGTDCFCAQTNQYILSPSIEASNKLLTECGIWSNELHEEIWVFDQGWWQKSRELYKSVEKASWDDVILKKAQKDSIISDVENFFDSKDTFDRLRVPWKRGVIFHGPPGNGKTISIKAVMAMLYRRNPEVPTLYVKSLRQYWGPEDSINQIFSLARNSAPCYLVFEDLDSLVDDETRSFFLNAVDGITRNDGIMMVGSTNHLERLDPGIAKRPSRFDRKFFFDDPDFDERVLYMQYWQGKLEDNTEVELPDKMCEAIAKITKGFSFAYLQEAMIASLLIIARDQEDSLRERICLECMEAHPKPENGSTCNRPQASRPFKGLYDWVWTVRQTDDENPDLDDYVLWPVIKKQIRILREELESERNGTRK